jgi:hypothetical protein
VKELNEVQGYSKICLGVESYFVRSSHRRFFFSSGRTRTTTINFKQELGTSLADKHNTLIVFVERNKYLQVVGEVRSYDKCRHNTVAKQRD